MVIYVYNNYAKSQTSRNRLYESCRRDRGQLSLLFSSKFRQENPNLKRQSSLNSTYCSFISMYFHLYKHNSAKGGRAEKPSTNLILEMEILVKVRLQVLTKLDSALGNMLLFLRKITNMLQRQSVNLPQKKSLILQIKGSN